METNGWLQPAPTVKQVAEVQDLQELSLPHEALQRAGPALGKNLNPLKVQLEAKIISRETQQIRIGLCSQKKQQLCPVIYLKTKAKYAQLASIL